MNEMEGKQKDGKISK